MLKKMKLKALLFFSVLQLSTAVKVYAAETYDQQSSAPWTYGEMKDGFFVRDFYEELSWISIDDPEYQKEVLLCQEARYLEELTPEMKEAGYILEDGIAISPEGDASENHDTVIISGHDATGGYDEYGYGFFSPNVDTKIHETCYLVIQCTDTGQRYQFDLYEANNYQREIMLPAGNYEITDGGISNDYTGEYPVSHAAFCIKNKTSTVIEFQIGKDVNINESEEEHLQIEESPEESIAENTKDAGGKSLKASAIVILVIMSIIIIGLLILVMQYWFRA